MIEQYAELSPPPPLGAYVARMVHARFTRPVPPERLSPDGYVKLTFILEGSPYYYSGEDVLDWCNGFAGHISPEADIHAIGPGAVRVIWVNFFPSGFSRLFGAPAHALNNAMHATELYLAPVMTELDKLLRGPAAPDALLQGIADLILRMGDHQDLLAFEPMQRVEQHIRRTHGTATGRQLADSAGISLRHLQRQAPAALGASIKQFSSIVRFNHAYALMKQRHILDLDTALACGYYDESHMLKDLTYYLGDRAKAFATMQRPMVDKNLGH